MKNININKIARKICALNAAGVERLFDKYDFQLDAMYDLEESFNSFAEEIHTFEIGKKGNNWLSALWNRFWHGKYNPQKVEEQLITFIAGGVLAKVLKRIAWIEKNLNDIEDIIMEFQDSDFNDINKTQLNNLKKKMVKILKNINAFDKQKKKIQIFLDKLLNNIAKTQNLFEDKDIGEHLLGDMIDSLKEIKEEMNNGEYELPSEYKEKLMGIYNKLKITIPVSNGQSSTEQSKNIQTDLDKKISSLDGKDADVKATSEEIGFLMKEVGNKVQGTVANFLNRNEGKLKTDIKEIVNKLHDGDNALVTIAKTNYELLRDALQNKQYKTFYEQLKKLIEDPYIQVKQSYQKTMKQNYGKEDLAIIEEAFKQYNPKSDFEKIMELFKKDIEKAPLPDPNAWRVTKYSKEAKIAMKIAKSLI